MIQISILFFHWTSNHLFEFWCCCLLKLRGFCLVCNNKFTYSEVFWLNPIENFHQLRWQSLHWKIISIFNVFLLFTSSYKTWFFYCNFTFWFQLLFLQRKLGCLKWGTVRGLGFVYMSFNCLCCLVEAEWKSLWWVDSCVRDFSCLVIVGSNIVFSDCFWKRKCSAEEKVLFRCLFCTFLGYSLD